MYLLILFLMNGKKEQILTESQSFSSYFKCLLCCLFFGLLSFRYCYFANVAKIALTDYFIGTSVPDLIIDAQTRIAMFCQ